MTLVDVVENVCDGAFSRINAYAQMGLMVYF
jgi:hypothetical protein